MTRAKWSRIALTIFVAGGVAWFLKLIAIPTTGGEDFESPVVALLFFAGLFGMFVGSTGLGSRLAQNASLPVYILAIVLSPIVIAVVFGLLDDGLKPIGEAGPDWYVDEAGITVMAILMVVVGLLMLRKKPELAPDRTLLTE